MSDVLLFIAAAFAFVLVASLLFALMGALVWAWLDLIIKGEWRGRKVWRGLDP
jgi:type IV secretory pathway VirB3-like protein